MIISIDEINFIFDSHSSVVIKDLKIEITEPDFKQNLAFKRNQFYWKEIIFPDFIQKIDFPSHQPKTSIWQDYKGKLKLISEY